MDLTALGLSPDQSKIYLALVRHSPATRQELRAHPELRDVDVSAASLAGLTGQGLIVAEDTRPKRYSCLPPDIAIESATRERLEQVQSTRASIADLMELYTRPDAGRQTHDFVEIVTGSLEVWIRRGLQLVLSASHEVRAFDRGPYADEQPGVVLPSDLDAAHQVAIEKDRIASGVRFRAIYDEAEVREEQRWATWVKPFHEIGEEIRVSSGLPAKLTLYDDHAASMPLSDPTGRIWGVCVVRPSLLLDCLGTLFEEIWERALPVSELADTATPGGPVNPDDRALISWLAAGLTDMAIAHQAGWSRSTVQRRLNALMQQHHVATRFQLGLQLGRTLTPDANTPTEPETHPDKDKGGSDHAPVIVDLSD